MSIIIAFLIFGFLIFTHELGHFLVAKKVGIGVTEFSIGMGPRIVSRQIGETRYSLKWIPFGGSCMMVGEDADSDEPNAFSKKPVWARFAVVAAGPLSNFLWAFLAALVVLAIAGLIFWRQSVHGKKLVSSSPGAPGQKQRVQVNLPLLLLLILAAGLIIWDIVFAVSPNMQLPLLRDGFRMVAFSVVIMIVVLFFRRGIMGTKELSDLFKPKRKGAR